MAQGKKKAWKARGLKGQILPTEVEFDFIKSNLFRVIHMDGAFGGLSPTGMGIHVAIYNERRAIPTKTVQAINPDGSLGTEFLDRRQVRKAFVREIEADLVLDLRTAITLQHWLTEKIAECAKAQGLTDEQLAEGIALAKAAQDATKPKPKKNS